MSRGRASRSRASARLGRERDGVQPQPTRIWVSGCLCIVPGPRGGVRIADELDGQRSMVWVERSWLTLPLPLDPFASDRFEVWRAPAGQSITPEQAAKQLAPALVAAVRDVAHDLWTPLLSED